MKKKNKQICFHSKTEVITFVVACGLVMGNIYYTLYKLYCNTKKIISQNKFCFTDRPVPYYWALSFACEQTF